MNFIKLMFVHYALPEVLNLFRRIEDDLDALHGRLIVLEERVVMLENLLSLDQEACPNFGKRHPQA